MVKFNCDCCGLCCRHVGKCDAMKDYDRGDGVCKYLNDENKCDIYEDRPIICNVQKLYERYFADKMSWDDYLALQYEGCKKIKAETKIKD